jgi:CheY-like chemotaxis protein
VVNDDPAGCEMLVRMVATGGFRSRGATSVDEAMTRMSHDLPRCAVLDLAAGGIGPNLKVLDAIRSHGDRRISEARVVLCAASPRNRTFSFQSGADSFLARPFHLSELLGQISDVLDRPHDERAKHRRDVLASHGD